MTERRSFLAPLLGPDAASHALVNARTGEAIAHHLLTAFDSAHRNKGLLGRDGLDQGSAMIIAPCTAVHTFFMRFSIDIAFVSRDGRILKLRHDVPAWRIAVAFGAHAVIELPAGALTRSHTVRGDTVTLRAIDRPRT